MDESDENKSFAARWAGAQPMVHSYVGSIIRNFHESEDVVQKVAIAAFKKADQYDATRSFNGWVLGITRLEILRWKRDRARDRHVFDDHVIENIAKMHQEFGVELEERRAALRACLSQLDTRAARFLEMRYVRDLPPTQIAKQFELEPNAVRVTLHRIRRALEQCMLKRLEHGGLSRGR